MNTHSIQNRTVNIHSATSVHGDLTVPGDKSLAHRALLLAALADGITEISGLPRGGADVESTISVLRDLGIEVTEVQGVTKVFGKPINAWNEPDDVLNCGNSGTTARLLLGILSGSNITATLTGDHSLRSRPMERVVTPLRKMGAQIVGKKGGGRLPLTVVGQKLLGTEHCLPIASAQVKSACLLAGLNAHGITTVTEPFLSRNHTETMLSHLGISLQSERDSITIKGGSNIPAFRMKIPGDPSSAAFWITLGALLPDSSISVREVCINNTRTGFYKLLSKMGAQVDIHPTSVELGEQVGSVSVKHSILTGISVVNEDIPSSIDELPLLALAATQANGITHISGAAELRVKEADRILATVVELRKFGANIVETRDGMIVTGSTKLNGAAVHSHGDHRIAMMLCIAGMIANGITSISDIDCVDVSYPSFFSTAQVLNLYHNCEGI